MVIWQLWYWNSGWCISICRTRENCYIKNKEQKTAEVIAADERTAQALQQEQDDLRQAQQEMQTAVDEVILKDNSRLVILNYGGGTDAAGVEEAVQGFLEPLLK